MKILSRLEVKVIVDIRDEFPMRVSADDVRQVREKFLTPSMLNDLMRQGNVVSIWSEVAQTTAPEVPE